MPSASQRSSVRLFRPSSAASFSIVMNSARTGTNSDMAISYARLRAHKSPFTEIHVRGIITEISDGFPPLYRLSPLLPLTLFCSFDSFDDALLRDRASHRFQEFRNKLGKRSRACPAGLARNVSIRRL